MKLKDSYKHRTTICFLLGIWLGLFGGVSLSQTTEKPGASKCSPVKSVINDDSGPFWKVTATNIKTKGSLTAVSFIDDQRGWVVGEKTAYQTDDGGRTWQAVKLSVPTDFHITKILFLSPSHGWAILENSSFDPEQRQVWLMSTEDGGLTWQPTSKWKGASEASISFASKDWGWLILNTFRPPRQYSFKLLRTEDEGKTWQDVSESLVKTLHADNEVCCPPRITNLIAESDVAATVSTMGGRLLSTRDGGHSWKEIKSPCAGDRPSNPGSIFGGNDAKFFWLAGGAFSFEGTWGTIYEQRAVDSWVRYDLPDFALSDALYVSTTNVLASGSIIDQTKGQGEGAILYSSDRGNTWSIIYRSGQVTSISSLTVTKSGRVWAVGEKGLVLRLESPLRSGL
jgi:photosystem II stability/assembly factor-like uncharacterized protein